MGCKKETNDFAEERKADLVGTTWIGNRGLLDRRLVGVFATGHGGERQSFERNRWAVGMGLHGCGIVGMFHSMEEKSVLKYVLEYGGSAVWILNRKLPVCYTRILARAFMEGRLLVVSCFWITRSVYGTAAYCAELVQHLAARLVLWNPTARGFIPQVIERARRNGKKVDLR